MQIYPEKNDQLGLTSEEKSFLRTVERAFSEEELAYYVLHINPRRKMDEEGNNAELFNLLIVSKGIILFRFLPCQVPEIARVFIQTLSNPVVFGALDNDIKARLEESRYLTTRDKVLKYALNICFVIPTVDFASVESTLSPDEKKFCKEHIVFKEDIQSLRKAGPGQLVGLLPPADKVSEEVVNNIFQRLCPEITIPKKYILDEHEMITGRDGLLEETDRAVQSYRLDDRQINFVNKISKGNQLILACAGSGKSVLLISKCFKLASLNPNEEFLITCFNRNLFKYYEWAIAQAGFRNKNVRCMSFYGLCYHLLESNGLPIPTSRGWKNSEEEHYSRVFEAVNNALASNRIKERFYGIFIDEVQIFKPEWYRFCFNLLKSKNAEDHFFVIAGDKSQDIKNNIKQGKAPWQGGGASYPEYRGKTLPIEINYRNSKPINDAIDRFVDGAKEVGTEIGVDLTSDPELFLRGTSYRPGNSPRLIELQQYSNNGESYAICDEIKRLLAEGLSEVDIAVIVYNRRSPYTTPGWETKHYELLSGIRRYFYKEGWEQPAILIRGESEGATYGSRRGVTIATIEGSLGLDFRAVILAGLRPLGTYEKARTIRDFQGLTQEQLVAKKEAFKKNINFIYTGCTRAKDELSIVLSEQRGNSIYMDLIRDTIGG